MQDRMLSFLIFKGDSERNREKERQGTGRDVLIRYKKIELHRIPERFVWGFFV